MRSWAAMELEMVSRVVLERIEHYLTRGRLAHAYLFAGPEGSGKLATARAVAKMVNCEARTPGQTFCGQCPSCLKIDAGNHPDVVTVQRGDEAMLKVDQVRSLIAQSQLRPYEAAYKVFIIDEAHALNLVGANAFLKTLEEPGDATLFMLTTEKLQQILPTIRSRCQIVRFFGESRERVSALLSSEGMPAAEALWLADFAEGCPGRAQSLAGSGFSAWQRSARRRFMGERVSDAELKEYAADLEGTRRLLGVLLVWFRDILLVKAGVGEERLASRGEREELLTDSRHYTVDQAEAVVRSIVHTMRMADENLSLKIPLTLLKEKVWTH